MCPRHRVRGLDDSDVCCGSSRSVGKYRLEQRVHFSRRAAIGLFDDEYFELNLNGGYGYARVDIAIGRYDNFSGPTLNYEYYTVSVEHGEFYTGISSWGDDYDGEVIEVGYGSTLPITGGDCIDFGIAVINSNDVGVRSSFEKDDDTSLVLSISKAFGAK